MVKQMLCLSVQSLAFWDADAVVMGRIAVIIRKKKNSPLGIQQAFIRSATFFEIVFFVKDAVNQILEDSIHNKVFNRLTSDFKKTYYKYTS